MFLRTIERFDAIRRVNGATFRLSYTECGLCRARQGRCTEPVAMTTVGNCIGDMMESRRNCLIRITCPRQILVRTIVGTHYIL